MRTIAVLLDPLRKVVLALAVVAAAAASIHATAYAATPVNASVNIWWPAQNAALDGTQPFKAVVDGHDMSDYDMYWSVDGGGQVKMYDSQADYPHKEAIVDLSGWNWSSTGTYSLSFIAKDHSGNEIARSAVTIKHGAPAPAPTAPNPLTNPTAPTPTISVAPATTTVTPVETARLDIRVWWPTANATVSGVQPLKAVLGSNLSAYRMYWSVDGGAMTEMKDSYADAPHKEAMIDFSSWTWKGSSAYVITLTAKDLKGNVVGTGSVSVYVKSAAPAPVAASAPTVSSAKLYVDPNNPAIAQSQAWASSRPADAAVMAKIGTQSTGIWLGGWNADVQSDVSRAMSAASSQGSMPTFVAYNIPGRDCGSYSAGGASNASEYLGWIRKVSAGLGSGKAILILEPDGIASIDCLSDSQKADRYSMLSQALDILKANNAGTKVYVDAGHSGWVNETEIASRLAKAGIAKAAGFSLNVSNFVGTDENVAYGARVSQIAGGAHFVVDTSRNGSGSNGEWCNPSGRSLGQQPTLSTGKTLVDAFLWAKKPGESDGSCNGGPSAGQWWPEYALGLGQRAGY